MLFNVIIARIVICNKPLNTFFISCVMKTMMHFEIMHNDAEEIGKSRRKFVQYRIAKSYAILSIC